MTNPFSEINRLYDLDLCAGILITVSGCPARIIGAEGRYLKVVFDRTPGIEKLIHPTEDVVYPNNLQGISDM